MSQNGFVLPELKRLEPAAREDLCEAIRQAAESRIPIYPIGGGTALAYGGQPTQPGWGLALQRFRQVVDYPARDLTITVEAGLPVAELQALLAQEGQRWPVDVPQADQATVGGVVACNLAGPRRYAWGPVSDSVLGLSAVDARGVIFSAGARVVKNAAGYNLCRLLVGSLGTLAVMTQATLMVKPLPETSAFVVCEVDDWDAGDRLLTALIRGLALPTAIELLAGPAWRTDPWWEPWNPPTKARLAVGLEGSAKEVAWQIEQLQSAWQAEGVRHIQTFPDAPAQQIWRRLTEFPLGPALGGSARPAPPGPEGVPLPFAEIQKEGSTPFGSPSEPGSVRETIVSEPQSAQTDDSLSEAQGSPYLIVEAGVLPSQVLPLTVRWLKIDPQVSVLAHAGHGSLIGYFPVVPAETGRCLRELILPAVAAWKGHVRVLDAPAGAQWTGEDLWNGPSLPHRLVQGIKKCFDPYGILNPGRLGFRRS